MIALFFSTFSWLLTIFDHEKKKAGKKKVVLELGGNAACVVDEDADVDDAVGRIVIGAFYQSGRIVIGVQRSFVHDSIYLDFKKKLLKATKALKCGDPKDPDTFIGPIISKKEADRIESWLQAAVTEGAEILCGGSRRENTIEATLLENVSHDSELYREEVFGPVILVIKVRSLEEAIEWINSIPYANTCTLFTNSGGKARAFTSQVDPSMIGINIGVPAPMAFFSFGGSKESFFGDIKAHGKSSVKFFTDTYTSIYRWHSDSSIWQTLKKILNILNVSFLDSL